MHLHLQNLSHCEIYILTTVKSITMTNSHHCKCIFGCISSRLTLNTVQEIKFSACTEQATFERCQNITAYLYIKKPSLVIGKCIHALFVAPINSWYKDINKNIKQAQIQLSNGQKNNWNSLRLVWFDKNNFDQAVNEQYETIQSPTMTAAGTSEINKNTMNCMPSQKQGQDQDPEINIYHKLDKILNLKKSDARLQEKIQKIFLLPSEYYELFVIPIFNKKKKSNSHLNLKTYSINNLEKLEYDENYQHSSSIMSMETHASKSNNTNTNKKLVKEKSSSSKIGKTTSKTVTSKASISKKKEKSSSELPTIKRNGRGRGEEDDGEGEEVEEEEEEEYAENSKNSVYSKNVLNQLPSEYYKSVMHKHEGHCIVHRILSDKNLIYHDTENDNNKNEESTEKEKNAKETEEDINTLVRNDFYKWLKDTNNIEQVQRLLNYRKDAS